MVQVLSPADEQDVIEAIADARDRRAKVLISGGQSKSGTGSPCDAELLTMASLEGIVDYQPRELVLTTRPGTRLVEIEQTISAEGQMLAFEPFDHGPVFGQQEGVSTMGGIIAAGIAGSRRLSAGGARDHLLGIRAVSGRALAFVGGGKVVKNVTGYDLPKLAANSWGRIAAITELTLKVVPRPETRCSVVLSGLTPEAAIRAMADALGSNAMVAAAAHMPAAQARASETMLRLEGFRCSVEVRAQDLCRRLSTWGSAEIADHDDAERFWTIMRTLSALPQDAPLWRVNVPPNAGASIIARLGDKARWLMDWGGGLLWVTDAGPDSVRSAAADCGGHATLVRAPTEMRSAVPAFHPPEPGLARLEARVRSAFDPDGVFDTGRF